MLRQSVLCSTLTWTTGAQVKAFSHGQWPAGHRLRLVRVMTAAAMVYRRIILCWNSFTQKSTLSAKLLLNAVSHLNVEHRNTVSYKSLCTDFTQTFTRELSQLHLSSFCETYCEITGIERPTKVRSSWPLTQVSTYTSVYHLHGKKLLFCRDYSKYVTKKTFKKHWLTDNN